jgi:hypothetical protein
MRTFSDLQAQPPARKSRDRRLFRLAPFVLAGALAALMAFSPAAALAAPTGVTAYYMRSTSASALNTEAYNDGYNFAKSTPAAFEYLLLDFGAARDDGSGVWGACDFSMPTCTLFSNAQIGTALQDAADGYHAGHSGAATVAVIDGNSNYEMSNSGMSNSDAYNAGYSLAYRAENLYNYQSTKGYSSQGAGGGTDMEPLYDGPTISLNLTSGLDAQGSVLGYDFGSADNCPNSGTGGTCANSWSVENVGTASWTGLWTPLPQIYSSNDALQWTVVQNTYGNGYTFYGVTADPAYLAASTAWNDLNSDSGGNVADNLICFGGC